MQVIGACSLDGCCWVSRYIIISIIIIIIIIIIIPMYTYLSGTCYVLKQINAKYFYPEHSVAVSGISLGLVPLEWEGVRFFLEVKCICFRGSITPYVQPMFLPQCKRPSFTSISNNRHILFFVFADSTVEDKEFCTEFKTGDTSKYSWLFCSRPIPIH
jgi:hypothetical protein